VVLSTSEPLDQLRREGCLSPALSARLRSAPTLDVPPLRERAEDLPLLLDIFRVQHGWDHQPHVRSASPGVAEVLRYYGEQTGWPGNVAELDHLIIRSLQKCDGEVLCPEHLDVLLPKEYRAIYNCGEGVQDECLSYRDVVALTEATTFELLVRSEFTQGGPVIQEIQVDGTPKNLSDRYRKLLRLLLRHAGGEVNVEDAKIRKSLGLESYHYLKQFILGLRRALGDTQVTRCAGGRASRFVLTRRGQRCAFNVASRFALIEKELSPADPA
jgi:DNA-binding NtrC family response regulator